jgi:hypothetical protein
MSKRSSDPIEQSDQEFFKVFGGGHVPVKRTPYSQRPTIANSANVNLGPEAGEMRRKMIEAENAKALEAESQQNENEPKKEGEE